MNVTFMIGNGFDLNLGLETQYSDFLKWYLEKKCQDTCKKECDDNCENFMMKKFKKDIDMEQENWAYAELAFGKYTADFKGDNGAENFCDCHEDFCINLAEYLKMQETKLIKGEIEKVKGSFHTSLLSCIKTLSEVDRNSILESLKNINEHITYNFINFNYTNTLSRLTKTNNATIGSTLLRNGSNGNIGRVFHVHGTVNGSMVLGVNDKSQISNMEIFEDEPPEFLDQIIKQRTNISNNQNTDQKANEMLSLSSLIYVYGMSIGETDALWWSRICKLMDKKSHLHVIVYAYDAPSNLLVFRKINTFKRELIEKFISFADVSDSVKNNIKHRFHIETSNIFKSVSDIAKIGFEELYGNDSE